MSQYPTAKPATSRPATAGSMMWPMAAVAGVLALVLLAVIGYCVFATPHKPRQAVADSGAPPSDTNSTDDLPPVSIKPQEPPPGDKQPSPPAKTPTDPPPSVKDKPRPQEPLPAVEPTTPKTKPPTPVDQDPPSTKTDPPLEKKAPPEKPALLPRAPGQAPVALLPLEPLDLGKGPSLLPGLPLSDLKFSVTNFKVGGRGKGLRLAVTSPGWDNLGSLLEKLGAGYKYATIKNVQMVDPDYLAQFDVIFINCAQEPLDVDSRIYANLRHYVQKGGTIYASDLRYHDLAAIFREYTVSRQGIADLQGNVKAMVVDEGLKRVLGQSVPLHFDLTHVPAAFNPQKAHIYLLAYQRNFLNGQIVGVPLLTKFRHGEGDVIFTSFHNSKQLSQLETKLLLYIIFSTVNSAADTKARQTLADKGYAAAEVKNLALSQGYSLAKQTFKHDGKKKLAVALGFRGDGAKLQLKLFTPDGKLIHHTDAGSFLVEIPDAPAGAWQYSITAAEAPYDNFPFTVIVGHGNRPK